MVQVRERLRGTPQQIGIPRCIQGIFGLVFCIQYINDSLDVIDVYVMPVKCELDLAVRLPGTCLPGSRKLATARAHGAPSPACGPGTCCDASDSRHWGGRPLPGCGTPGARRCSAAAGPAQQGFRRVRSGETQAEHCLTAPGVACLFCYWVRGDAY